MTRTRATSIGFGAVLLWSLLALLAVGSAPVPPFQLNALTFAIGGCVGIAWALASGNLDRLRRVPLRVYVFGTIALFGYHALYFSAMRMAPAAEASLIAYLWPLLIVLFSGLLPHERLTWAHVLGAAIAFSGAAMVVIRPGIALSGGALPGYILAMLCAITWAAYSVLSRRMGSVPTEAVAVFCLATAALSVPAHLMFEQTQWPIGTAGWLAVAGLGLGPVGLAFYVWDIGVKKGDIQLLGVASYAAPLLSTLALILAGLASASPRLIVAAMMITAGAALAAWASAGASTKRVQA